MTEFSETNSLSSDRPSTRGSSSSSTFEYGQESFATFQHKISDLCSKIGYGKPSHVERLKGGSYNRVIEVAFPDGQKLPPCVIRIPRFRSEHPESPDIKNQFAIIHAIERDLPVARVYAYSLTAQNPIESEYIIQERLPGTSFDKVYGGLSHLDRRLVVKQIVNIICKIESIEFKDAGRLVASSSVPFPSSSTACRDISCPLEVTGFGTGSNTSDPGQARVTPAKDLDTFFRSQFDAWETYEASRLSAVTAEYWKRLKTIYEEMRELFGLSARENGIKNVLSHVDLEPRNMIALPKQNSCDIIGILDWDNALSVPKVLGRKPPVWLWDFGDGPSDWDGDVDLLSSKESCKQEAELKKLFDDEIELRSPGYCEDAYGSGRWLRRLARFALSGFSDNEDIKRYDIFVKDWKMERKIRMEQQAQEIQERKRIQERERIQAQKVQEETKAQAEVGMEVEAQEIPTTDIELVQEMVQSVPEQKKRQILERWLEKVEKVKKRLFTKHGRRGKQKSMSKSPVQA